MQRSSHPLAELIEAAAAGRFPPADGRWQRVRPWRMPLEGILSFTGHAVLAVADDISDQRLRDLGVDGFGGAHDPRLIAALAGADGWIDSLDVLLAARGTRPAAGRPRLVRRPDLAGHSRVAFAARIRDDVQVFGYDDVSRTAVAVVARGLAGLTELSFEIEADRRGVQAGTDLVSAALEIVPSDRWAIALAAPGNAASLRALLGAGFTPLGSVQLFRRYQH